MEHLALFHANRTGISFKFIQKASQYVGIEELTPYVLHGLGFIPLNELLTSEKA